MNPALILFYLEGPIVLNFQHPLSSLTSVIYRPTKLLLSYFKHISLILGGFPDSSVKNLPSMQGTLVQFLGWKDLLETG